MNILNQAKNQIKNTFEIVRKALKDNNLKGYNKRMIFGIFKEKTISGPDLVQIDLTNKCNNTCIGCWLYSPYVNKDKEELKNEIPTKIVINTINQLHKLRTKRILFSGGGEPTVHKDFLKIIKATSKKKIQTYIITNFVKANKKFIDKIIDYNINQIFISLWASNSQTYKKTHPKQNKEIFSNIVNSLKYLVAEKKRRKKGPMIILLNTISKANYNDVLSLAKLASKINVDRIEFVTMELIKGKTEFLKFSRQEIREIKKQLREIENNSESGYLKEINESNEFTNKVGITELWGFERFKKRIYSYNKKEGFDKSLVDSIPCYAGYSYARIMADGKVIPCCKAHLHSLGNINKKRFNKIWFSYKYEKFRLLAKNEKKNNPYFKKINCYKGCDNFIENKKIHGIIQNVRQNKR